MVCSVLDVGFFDGFGPPDDFTLNIVLELCWGIAGHRIEAFFGQFGSDIIELHQRIRLRIEFVDDGHGCVDGRKKTKPIAHLKTGQS